MGHTKAAKHKVVLKDPDTPPFKERFCQIPPLQLDKVCAYLKMMLDADVFWPSNSPWCNAVVLVRKKDGLLCFCIDFQKLNSLTIKDSHPPLAFVRHSKASLRLPTTQLWYEFWVLAGPSG